jgi:hypothetical protein
LRGGRGDDDRERGGDRRAAVRFAGFCPHHGTELAVNEGEKMAKSEGGRSFGPIRRQLASHRREQPSRVACRQ